MIRLIVVLSVFALTACGAVQPASPGHEPPSGGDYNPVSGTRANSR